MEVESITVSRTDVKCNKELRWVHVLQNFQNLYLYCLARKMPQNMKEKQGQWFQVAVMNLTEEYCLLLYKIVVSDKISWSACYFFTSTSFNSASSAVSTVQDFLNLSKVHNFYEWWDRLKFQFSIKHNSWLGCELPNFSWVLENVFFRRFIKTKIKYLILTAESLVFRLLQPIINK